MIREGLQNKHMPFYCGRDAVQIVRYIDKFWSLHTVTYPFPFDLYKQWVLFSDRMAVLWMMDKCMISVIFVFLR